MATFSKKERIIASILSATPGLKAFLKSTYISMNAVLHKKKYTIKLMSQPISVTISDPLQSFDNTAETFGGYYDNATMNAKGLLLSHVSHLTTTKLPAASPPVDIVLTDIHTRETKIIGKSSAYNWQQGTRLHWLNDDLFMYNDFNDQTQQNQAKIYSVSKKAVTKTYPYPAQATYHNQFYLSINYQRLLNMRPDYGYRNLPLLTQDELNNMENDGIWKTDNETGQTILLHSLKDVAEVEKKDIFEKCTHKVNHLIISPDGKGFMFIHRYYLGKRRFDRLLYSDFKTIKVLINEEYVSHCCWVDNTTILGYLKAYGQNGYYFLDLATGKATLCPEMSNLNLGDGHPSCFKDWIVFDSYPDKSRMQRLLLFNLRTKTVNMVAELYQNTKYKNETRCDLHPRFSTDGKHISFDTVYLNKRRQCLVNIEQIQAL